MIGQDSILHGSGGLESDGRLISGECHHDCPPLMEPLRAAWQPVVDSRLWRRLGGRGCSDYKKDKEEFSDVCVY